MKKYWKECERCYTYKNGKKQHKIVCYQCGECLKDGKPLFSDIF